MAKVVVDNQLVVTPWRNRVVLALVAAIAGIAWWALTNILAYFVVEPLSCRQSAGLEVCGNAFGVAGSLATAITAAALLFVLVTLHYRRALLIVVGAAAVTWSLGKYITGLVWYEGAFWAAVIYVASYLFSLIVTEIRRLWVVGVVMAFGVLLIRVLIAF